MSRIIANWKISKELRTEYDDLKFGERKFLSTYHFKGNADMVSKTCTELIRYALEYHKGWNYNDVINKLSLNVIDELRLASVYEKVVYTPEFNKKDDLEYLVYLMYPQKHKINFREKYENVYKSLLRGDLKRFPKGFYENQDGRTRILVCLQYVLTDYKFSSIEDIYTFFASTSVREFLRKYKLSDAYKRHFYTPIDYVHAALPASQRNELLYRKLIFEREFKEGIKTKKANN